MDPRYLYDDTGRKTRSNRKLIALDDVQEVSIHKINLNHRKFNRMSIEYVIHAIVDTYNDMRAEKKHKFIKKRVHDSFQPFVKDEDEEHFEGDDFQVAVYLQKVPKKISLLNSYGIREKAITIHSLIFHYRENELFAITTNQAWNVVQWCCDFEFPGIIAARILSKDGELESTNKGLVGTELTRKTTHKQQKKTNPYNILTFCTRFTAELRDNASILRLSCFQKKNLNSESGEESVDEERVKVYNKIKGIKVTVSLGNVRILKRFSASDILSILSVLSEISNGRKTVDLDGKNEENSTAHKKYLTAVHTEVAKELNVCLSKIIHDAIANDNDMAELDNYQFCHKHSTDFFNGYDFKLYHNGDLIKDFKNETPSIKQIVIELRSCLGDISRDTSDEGFYQLLNKVKISYNYGTNGKVKKQEKFINFIDGLMYHSRDNSVFWHVNAMWCHVQDGYLYLAHEQFKNILNNFLLVDKNDPGYLKCTWPIDTRQQRQRNVNPDAKLKEYLKAYSDSGDTWTCENPGHDIVDMIKIGKDTATGKKFIFVYYFLPTPNYKTNIKCNHVSESIMQIGKANKCMMGQTQGRNDDVAGSEDVKKQLNSVYKKVVQKRQFKTICPDFETFLKLMTGAKFILAIGRESGNQPCNTEIPSLEKEKVMPTKVTINDIADIFENMVDLNVADDMRMLKMTSRTTLNQPFQKDRCLQLAESIHNLLKEKEFIEAKGNSIKGKLLSQSKKSFDLTSDRSVDEFLCEKIIYKFQPRVCSVLSKLGFIDMREEISKLTITSFNIIEIPCEEL